MIRKKFLTLCALGLVSALVLGGYLTRAVLPAFLNTEPDSMPTIVIDAGHGGEDGGAVSANGVVESGINLAIAQRMNALFLLLGYDTKMTRTEDVAIYSAGAATLREKKSSDLKNRVALVNDTPNAVLLSIHQNSLPSSHSVHGAQAFYAPTEGSAEMAEAMQAALNAVVNAEKAKAKKPIDKSVYLMKNVRCPAVLVECGFLSNAAETALLQEGGYQTKLAMTITAGYLQSTQTIKGETQ